MDRKRHRCVCLFWVLCVIVGCHARVWAVEPGDVVFETNFGTEAEQALWSAVPSGQWIQDSNSATLRVQVAPGDVSGHHTINRPLTLQPWRGCELLFTCRVKAQDVTRPAQPYLGVKYLL
ncbi:MAG: hypothetical protein HQ515_01945, partial [Phycisphaeraceae bacterium]|nr:hypothetical protein [Phycisphaeraceae bacterium]